jgi:putative membrane protein
LPNFKLLSIALAILGAVVATLLIGWFGFGRIAGAILAVGGYGFELYAAWQVLLFVLMGVAWWVVVPPGERRLLIFVWGRMVRDAAASCLPFSQVGGFVLGARAITLHGVSAPVATITTVVDATAEFVAEILFLTVGLMIVLVRGQGMGATTPIVLGLGAALIAGVIAMGVQHRAAPLFVWFGGRVLGQWVAAGSDGETVSEAELRRIYGHAGRVATGTSLHLIAWCGKGAGNWIAFRLLGTPVDISTALAIEALLHAALAAAFLVPGNAGVQEAGYVGVGALFGATPEIALAVSLLRRARDLAVGVPILLFWQFVELRRLRAARSGYQSAGPQTRM